MADCLFCENRYAPKSVVQRGTGWDLLVNGDQALLGRCVLALKRHETDITQLTPREQAEFWELTGRVKRAIGSVFAPDHMNYFFFMNQVAHAHFHIVPRYKVARSFAGLEFSDPHYGGAMGPESFLAPDELLAELAAAIGAAL